MGDLILVSDVNTVIRTSEDRHGLPGLDVPLRSHGGVSEQIVLLIFNPKVAHLEKQPLRNFDVFDITLNHVSVSTPS